MNNDFSESMSNENTAYILATSREFMRAVRQRLPGVPFPEPVRYPAILVANAETREFRLFYEDSAPGSPVPTSAFIPQPEEPVYVA